jgi:AAA+ superfamily predicted ATPase
VPAPDAIDVTLPTGGFKPTEAIRAVRDSGLPDQFAELASGPFGHTSVTAGILEALAESLDLALAGGEALEGVILDEIREDDDSLTLPSLSREQRQLVASFELVVLADAARRHLAGLVGLPDHEGSLDLDGLDDLLAEEQLEANRLERVLRLANGWLHMKSKSGELDRDAGDETGIAGGNGDDRAVGRAVAAFFGLLRRAILTFVDQSAFRPLVDVLENRDIAVAAHPYDGLQIRERTDDRSGLRPVSPDDVVGNDAFLEAGMRLARDVAGYDFDADRNPKHVNPILFGLGPPGSGKTYSAHAIGNYFLDYCRERDVPSRFRVVRRTDWASSYQNASARNLVQIFREEVYECDGVCGVYWPDIDTAFASRSSQGLRMEEKQNLGAVFGIFDGTLLPKDGSWFLICDANTLHMDDATVSRIAQNPMRVEGPTEPDQYVELMRDIQFADLRAFVPDGDDAWQKIGERAAELDLTGRNIESMVRNVRAIIQDFEYPEEYFEVGPERRREIVRELSTPVDADTILREMNEWHEFQRDAEREAERERFQEEVNSIVEHLNAAGSTSETE